jgi:hypothetical protein
MRILVAGGFDANDPQADEIRAFCRDAGKAVVAHGHVLLNGARTELDALIAEAAADALQGSSQDDRDQRIVSYVLSGQKPAHTHGTLIRSQLSNWEIGSANFYVPEQVAQADVVVLIGGFEGTYRAANWAAIARKPLLPFAAFGGAAAEIFQRELNDFDKKYSGRIKRLEFEQLNSIKNWADHATDVVALAEKVAESRGLGGKVIVTARRGTELPFDVKDIPTILWESQEELGEDLRERIQSVVKSLVPQAGPPIGPS